ncbi:MAG: flagellar hook-associated protein FlgK [Pseudomonadota bacterium]
MSLTSAINSALSGLQVTSLRADTVATNIANASTPGYVRRALIVSEALVGGSTAGVRSEGVARSQNAAITEERRAISTNLAQANILTTSRQTLSVRIGNSLDSTGLFSRFATFETALSEAALTPESSTQAANLLDSAVAVANEFNALSSFIERQRAEADRGISEGVEIVNQSLRQVEKLNGRIAGSQAGSDEEAALVDERQRALDTIAEFVPIESFLRPNNVIDVLTPEGVFLLSGSARQIAFSPSAAFSPDASLAGGQLSGLSVGDIDITPGVPTYGAVSGGALGALFQLRDDDLPTLSNQLDTLANDLISRVSDDTVDPSKIPGDPGIFLDSDPTLGPGVAGRIRVNAAVDPNQGGDLFRLRDGLGAVAAGPPGSNEILSRLSNAISTVRSINENGLEGGFSSAELASHLSAIAGQDRINQEAVLSSTVTQLEVLIDAEQSISGVDIDEQLQTLLLVEQAFAANARVIEVTGQLLNQLLEI